MMWVFGRTANINQYTVIDENEKQVGSQSAIL
jgi:hypothetical protein